MSAGAREPGQRRSRAAAQACRPGAGLHGCTISHPPTHLAPTADPCPALCLVVPVVCHPPHPRPPPVPLPPAAVRYFTEQHEMQLQRTPGVRTVAQLVREVGGCGAAAPLGAQRQHGAACGGRHRRQLRRPPRATRPADTEHGGGRRCMGVAASRPAALSAQAEAHAAVAPLPPAVQMNYQYKHLVGAMIVAGWDEDEGGQVGGWVAPAGPAYPAPPPRSCRRCRRAGAGACTAASSAAAACAPATPPACLPACPGASLPPQ